MMSDQAESWSRAAAIYEREFVDPHLPGVRSPLRPVLRALARRGARTVADLGCGIGPLLPFLSEHFAQVWGVDFAAAMLARARTAISQTNNVTLLQRPLDDLEPLHGRLDLAVAVNSLVMPEIRDLERALEEIRRCLKPGGAFLGILPAMDAVHYQTMLLQDRALERGLTPEAARKNAAHHNDHALYDFGFGEFHFQGLRQHFWQPFEVRYRLARAGFTGVRLKKVHLAWKQISGARELHELPPPWDWFFQARTGDASGSATGLLGDSKG
jgi:SAM-dependent methyltransferase